MRIVNRRCDLDVSVTRVPAPLLRSHGKVQRLQSTCPLHRDEPTALILQQDPGTGIQVYFTFFFWDQASIHFSHF